MTKPDTAILDERKQELEQYSRALVQAETQQASATTRIAEIEVDITARGYDPASDLDEQLTKDEADLEKRNASIGELLSDINTRLAPEEAGA